MPRYGWLGVAAILWLSTGSLARAQQAEEPAGAPSAPVSDEDGAPEGSAATEPSPEGQPGKDADAQPGGPRGKKPSDLSPEEARKRARAAYAQGQEHFEAGRFAEAEAAFVRAYGLVPNPVVLLGVAESRERKGNLPGAIAAFEQYLRERPDAPDAEPIGKRVRELKATPATLVVTSEPEGAAVSLDGGDWGSTTPAEIELAPGEHAVAIGMEGYVTQSGTVVVQPGGRHELAVELESEAPPAEAQAFGAGEGVPEPEAAEKDAKEDGEGKISAGVWAATGVAASALVAGTVLGFMALNQQSEFDDAPSDAAADKGERLALVADVAFGVALGAAVTGLVLYLTDDVEAEEDDEASEQASVDVAPAIGRRGGGLTARVRF